MYPTVNSLMGLWEFVIADGFTIHYTTAETQAFLDAVTVDQLQRPDIWRKLCTMVRLKPDQDILPVRAKYDGQTYTIGLNNLTADHSLWYTLADCIVSKLLGGKAPRVEQASTYRPGMSQVGLKSIKIMGHDDYRIDPQFDDLFRRLIDLRDEAKAAEDPIEKTLKIIANSSSYGIFIEVNRDESPKAESLRIFGPDEHFQDVQTKNVEEPGRYFHPLLGILITVAARLMLGIAEKKVLDCGLDWAFCDTDSLAMVRPDGLSEKDFHEKGREIIEWFSPLNPYKKPESFLKMENINFGINSNKLEPLYCFAISAKRYALFNISDGMPVIRKASAHGLGHLIDPYSEQEAPAHCSPPRVPLAEIGVKRWHYDLWIKIIQAATSGNPDRVLLDWHPAFSKPAALRYTASSPQLLSWMDKWNASVFAPIATKEAPINSSILR